MPRVRASLYDHPEIYATLLAPEEDLLEDLDSWVEEYLEGNVRRVLDPACGPGNFLLPYAREGCHVGGNDIRAGMIARARADLAAYSSELTRGDMVRLRLRSGPFDLALNLSSSVGHLPTDAAVVKHLRSVARQLRPGGLYFLGLTTLPRTDRDEQLWPLWQSEPTPLPSGGLAAVRYESLRRDGPRRRERIRVVLLANNVPGCPPVLQEEYTLRTFPPASLLRILKRAGAFELLAAHDMEHEERAALPLGEGSGDVTLILRRR